MSVRSALRFLRDCGPWRVTSLANGTLVVKPIGRRRREEKHGVLTRMGLALALEAAINRAAEEEER